MIEILKEINNENRLKFIGIITCMCLICMIPLAVCLNSNAYWLRYTDFGAAVAILTIIPFIAGTFGLLVPFILMLDYLFNLNFYARKANSIQSESNVATPQISEEEEKRLEAFKVAIQGNAVQSKDDTVKNVMPEHVEQEKYDEKSSKFSNATEMIIPAAAVNTAASSLAHSHSHYSPSYDTEFIEPYDEFGNRMDELEFELADEYYDEYGEWHPKNDNVNYVLEDDEDDVGYSTGGYSSQGYVDPYDDMADFDDLDEEDKVALRNEMMLDSFIISHGGNPLDFDDRMDAMFDPFHFGDND